MATFFIKKLTRLILTFLKISGERLQICASSGDCFIAHNVLPDEWSDVEISQHPEGDEYRYDVKVNGVVIGSMLNKDAQVFEDVRMYASDPTGNSSQGSIRNINVMPDIDIQPPIVPDNDTLVPVIDDNTGK